MIGLRAIALVFALTCLTFAEPAAAYEPSPPTIDERAISVPLLEEGEIEVADIITRIRNFLFPASRRCWYLRQDVCLITGQCGDWHWSLETCYR